MKQLILKPRVSEKGYALSEQINTYIFEVPAGFNKFDIAAAVAAQYEVGVTKVRLAGVPGKAVRSYRDRGRRSINSRRSDIRKAYVTLKEGDSLPIFAAVEEPEAPKEVK
ncbi:MAG TPA: 50S ribosomal protein L23 [Candidatus Saccharimonadales bacterium]|nr:50S ribosomal protein L23 [Candidatus Saccharimonadales bacterium]